MEAPLILWFRRDLRLDDQPMLAAAAATGRPLIPVFLADRAVTGLGAAARWRMGEAVSAFAQRLAGQGSRLVLRRGEAAEVLPALARESGARGVWWSRLLDPQARAAEAALVRALSAEGREGRGFGGHVLAEPGEILTRSGGAFQVFTPYWRVLSDHPVPAPEPAPKALRPPASWPASETLDSWRLGAAMNRGAAVLARYAETGEPAALARLRCFLDGPVRDYAQARDFPGREGVSGLSENLTYGEIGPRRIWHAALARELSGGPDSVGARAFRRELAWRDFAHYLMAHTPHLLDENWKAGWDAFPWQGDGDEAERWRRAQTGEPLVDAGLRQMYVTGRMHNRARMVVASYLCKHLMTHWKIGQEWFADCLTDWDPAANAMGWQWVAGSGPDAAPYFRVFNPRTQWEKFDKTKAYTQKFILEGSPRPGAEARDWFEAVPRVWGLDPGAPYPAPMITPEAGRARALAAFAAFRDAIAPD